MISEVKRTLNVLIIENNPIDIKILVDMLSDSDYGVFQIITTDTLQKAFESLAQAPCDIVLLDLNLKESKGLETLFTLHKRYPLLPIVVNTGVYQDDLGLKAVTCGAQDYLIKGKYKPYVLQKALCYAVERKKFEQELQSAYQRLQEAQTQLIQAEKMNVIGGLASGVAHEVKNPLATILYGIEYLGSKVTERDEKVELTFRSIKEATEKANNIIKDLLDFASPSKLQQKPEDLNAVIEQSLHFIKYHCDSRNVRVAKQYDAQLPKVSIDKNRIEQVIVDVILNAVFVMKDGGEITLKTYSRQLAESDQEWFKSSEYKLKVGDKVVILDVEDTGPGIAEEILPKIFDPFFTTRRAEGGVGLGLSIARSIMKSHEGFINVDNIKGGARARLTFRA